MKVAILSALVWVALCNPARASGVCVLIFERAAHPITLETEKIFQTDKDATIISEALPTDLLNCMIGDYEEIILIAHAVKDPQKPGMVSLGYFTPLSAADVAQGLQSGEFIPGTNPPNWQLGQPLYAIKEFLPQIFRAIHSAMQVRRASGAVIPLKRIRWMSCLPQEVFAAYPEFKDILDDFHVGMDIAPKQVIMSIILGESLTGFDRLWLADSAQADQPVSADWFFSYIDLNTIFIDEFGESTALHGKYKIHYQGFALGLSTRWTELFMRYQDVDSMQVGETRTISGPRLDISAGLGEDFELDILPDPSLGIPSDLSSVGVALSLWENIQVERMY